MKWFDVEGFMEYAMGEYPEVEFMSFTYNLLENTIKYLMDEFDDNMQLAITISNIVPEIKVEKVLKFCAK